MSCRTSSVQSFREGELIRTFDFVLAVNGTPVRTIEDYAAAFAQHSNVAYRDDAVVVLHMRSGSMAGATLQHIRAYEASCTTQVGHDGKWSPVNLHSQAGAKMPAHMNRAADNIAQYR